MTAPAAYSARLPLVLGFAALALLIGGVGLWSLRTQIAGAIIASGMIVVENNRQVVQHSEGGIVGAIHARDGDLVQAGEVLLRLDDTLIRSELALAELQLIEFRARTARLEAERDGAETVRFPAPLLALGDAETRKQVEGQRKLFAARRATLEEEQSQIAERIMQTRNRIAGAEAQLAALRIQEGLITAELQDQEALLQKGLVQAQRVSALRREAARLAGEIGKVRADVAQFKGEIAAFGIEAIRLETTRREAAIAELRDIQFRAFSLEENRLLLEERLARLDVRAPTGGIVYGSTVFGEGAVLRPADPLMFVIPQDQPLVVSARVEAIHIDQVFIGQPATLRFTAFNQRLTPEVAARVSVISADVFADEVTGLNYYRVELVPLAEELPKLEGKALLPGMPVEAFLKTGERTPMSYLTKPLTDYFGRAFRES